jgi:hypothetical protein
VAESYASKLKGATYYTDRLHPPPRPFTPTISGESRQAGRGPLRSVFSLIRVVEANAFRRPDRRVYPAFEAASRRLRTRIAPRSGELRQFPRPYRCIIIRRRRE